MHLVLGHPEDSCCAALLKRLASQGFEARLTAAPLEAPSLHSLRIDPNGSASTELRLGDGPAEPVESVFVRSSGAVDPVGWDPVDHAYMQAELQAAMLAWLSALECPVVNRVNAELWYRRRLPLLHWLPLLRACGLRIPETIVTDSAEAIGGFRDDLEGRDVPGAVFMSLAQHNAWLVGPGEWDGVMALKAYGPVCLMEPHGSVTMLCVVGHDLVWGGDPSPAEAKLAAQLRRFARTAGLDFVEIGLARVEAGLAVVHVDPLPRLEHFAEKAQGRILDALTDLLVGRMAGTLAEVQP